MQLQLIQDKIHVIRGVSVMLDFDLAELYEVETRVLNQAVRRNIDIFPYDFMFQLSENEWDTMLSQNVMTYPQKRPKSALPLAFTEHGIAMLSNVLKSRKARQTSVAIVRAFIALNKYVRHYSDLSLQLEQLEKKYNQQFEDVFEVINYLIEKDKRQIEQKERKRIGFRKGT